MANLNYYFCQFEVTERYSIPNVEVVGDVGSANETLDFLNSHSQDPRWMFQDTLMSRRGPS